MSEFKTDKISPRSGTTQTIGDSGDSVSTSSGSTINNAGTITTAGITGGTINNTTGEIYLRGEVDWQPSDIKTASFTATDNQGFFVNTTSGQITVTLPASPSAGDVVGIKDYANTFDTNKCILNANGNKIQGSTELFEIIVEGSSIIIIYVDATQGWVITDASKAADISEAPSFINATGGTITECGDYKIHTFTAPGTFCVSAVGNPIGGPSNVDYLVVGGGGAGGTAPGTTGAGGGGAGGYRTTFPSPGCNAGAFPISATTYPITVGGGGSAGGGSPSNQGGQGSSSIFSSITSTGGGGGGNYGANGAPGGSGGGAGLQIPTLPSPGSGNTPPVSPSQGNNGGVGTPSVSYQSAGGGGGANANGSNATGSGSSPGDATPSSGGAGGNGNSNSITNSPVSYSGGGGGGGAYAQYNSGIQPGGIPGGSGGLGGGGAGGSTTTVATPGTGSPGTAGTTNTGGGGGGSAGLGPATGGAGGSGIVIIRYKFQ
ncbi:glycine-rich domain-containing protein [Planctomycetota bacterium]